jgi:hypothetical protein
MRYAPGMATMKEIAMQASDEAFREAIRAAISALSSNLIQAKSEEERTGCMERYKTGLLRCKELHEASAAAIQEVF